jgi:5-methylcytosine-specific restriction endonuclease McrA
MRDAELQILADCQQLVDQGDATWLLPDTPGREPAPVCHLCQRATRNLVAGRDGLSWCPDDQRADCLFAARGRLRIPLGIRFEWRARDRTEQVRDLVEREVARVKKDRGRARWLRDRPPRTVSRDQVEFFRSPEWADLRRQAIDRARGQCEKCDRLVAHESEFDIHHVTYARFGGRERLPDLMALCGDCHVEVTVDAAIEKDGAA